MSASAVDTSAAIDLNALRIMRWAHRGAGKTAPENTLVAIRQGAARGFTAVEFDTMPTADGHWILHHDWVTGRTLRPVGMSSRAADEAAGEVAANSVLGHRPQAAGAEEAAAQRRIVDLTLDEIAALEAGSWLDSRFAGEPVPLLAQALQLCDALGLQVNVELKLDLDSGVFTPARLADSAASLMTVMNGAFPHADRLVLSSFGLPGLYAARQAGYTGRLAPLFEVLDDHWVEHARQLDAEAVHTHHSQASAEWVRRVHTTGRAFRVYTVNDADRLLALDAMGVDDCFTDNMDFAGV